MVQVKGKFNRAAAAAHFLLLLLIVVIFFPGKKETESPGCFLCGMIVIECIYLFHAARKRKKCRAYSEILSIVWGVMLLWELLVTKLDLLHPVLVPSLENIFAVFAEDWKTMLIGIGASLRILFLGVFAGLFLGTLLGLVCGWCKKLREVFYPIANVLAPIPSIVFAPYIIALMPTF